MPRARSRAGVTQSSVLSPRLESAAMKTPRLLTGFVAIAAVSVLLAQTKPPAAPVRDVTDIYFGQTIVDPYRWMEKADPEFVAWLGHQNAYSRAVLATIPGLGILKQQPALVPADSAKVAPKKEESFIASRPR